MKGNIKLRKLGESLVAVIGPKQGRRRRWPVRGKMREQKGKAKHFFIFYGLDFLVFNSKFVFVGLI